MASKSDLLEAQSYSRRRLLTAFVSGAPGGNELEPAKPLRGVIVGIALSVVVVLASLFTGFLARGLPNDWGNGKLIVDSTTGARYVSDKNTLHPVLNIASARLLLTPAASAKPIVTSGNLLLGKPIGKTLGIPGAPDTMPDAAQLVNIGWTACIADETGRVDARVSKKPIARETSSATAATIVRSEGTDWVIAGERRFMLPSSASDGLLRNIGLGEVRPRTVSTAWLNLFQPGSPLNTLNIDDIGRAVPGGDLRVGDVVPAVGGPDRHYVIMPDATLAPLSDFALALYRENPRFDAKLIRDDVDQQEVRALPNATQQAQAKDWPTTAFTPIAAADVPCALSGTSATGGAKTSLATAPSSTKLRAGTNVDVSAGALVSVSGFGDGSAAITMLIDSTATTYAVPRADTALLQKLGYQTRDVGRAQAPWLELFRGGPELTPQAAGATSNGPDAG